RRDVSRPLSGEQHTEVVVIGGGFTGLSAALHLAKRGRKVVLLEGKTIGWGGSGRNNGQVIPVLAGSEPEQIEKHYGEAGERLVRLIGDSADFLFKLAASENIACEAEQTGWFQPAHSPGHVNVSQARVEAWNKRGVAAELLDGNEAAALLGSSQWYGGMLNRTGGHINPLALARGLAGACEKYGVEVFEQSIVDDVQKKGHRWRVVTSQGAVECDAVLMATNAYSNELSNSLQRETARSVLPITSFQMATEPVSTALRKEILPGRQAVSDTRGDLHFFRYDARNRLVTGAAMMMTWNAAQRLRNLVGKRMARTFPQLGVPTFSHVWSGFVGITPDHLPHFHQLGDNYWSAIGFNGRGVALSVSIGRELARAIDGDDLNDLALPLSRPKPILFHSMARRVARGAIAYYRWRDGQQPKV
ncbi:MAG TPA: FAD-binding oxidoreductase, partial [Rhizobiales bacterium]|nr:FAD-binding oxidoreductase [Hyphomicrobiales bacterium]